MEKKEQEIEIRSAKHEFSVDELQELARKALEKTRDIDELEDEKKSVMSEFKNRIDKAVADLNIKRRKYLDGFEIRQVECRVDRDFENGVIRYIRIDTGEELEAREMSAQEKQMRLDDVKTAEVEVDALVDLLSLIDVHVLFEQVDGWSREMKKLAGEWAGAVRLSEDDPTVTVPPVPQVIRNLGRDSKGE